VPVLILDDGLALFDSGALATALSWIEFRNLPGFRDGRPRLGSWYDSFAKRPSMLATPLAGEVVD